MIVYRLERNGLGPYMSRSNAYRVTKSRMVYRRVKKYSKLLLENYKRLELRHFEGYQTAHSDPTYIFGCRSKEGLKTYFYGDFKPLFKEGFRVKRYNVPDEEIVDMGIEVAFPVKYHKLQTVNKVRQALLTPA